MTHNKNTTQAVSIWKNPKEELPSQESIEHIQSAPVIFEAISGFKMGGRYNFNTKRFCGIGCEYTFGAIKRWEYIENLIASIDTNPPVSESKNEHERSVYLKELTKSLPTLSEGLPFVWSDEEAEMLRAACKLRFNEDVRTESLFAIAATGIRIYKARQGVIKPDERLVELLQLLHNGMIIEKEGYIGSETWRRVDEALTNATGEVGDDNSKI